MHNTSKNRVAPSTRHAHQDDGHYELPAPVHEPRVIVDMPYPHDVTDTHLEQIAERIAEHLLVAVEPVVPTDQQLEGS